MKKTRDLFIVIFLVLHTSLYASAIQQPWLDNKIQLFIKDKPVKAMVYGLWINGKPISVQAVPAPVLHSFSQDRGIYEDATFWDPSWTASSGSMTSTIEDLGIWANTWMSGNLLTDNSTQQLRAPETVGKGKNTNELYFAMGFGVANHWLIQNPRFGGYSGVFAVLPEKQIVFIAFNTLKPTINDTNNLSAALWKELAADLAPEYPLPDFK